MGSGPARSCLECSRDTRPEPLASFPAWIVAVFERGVNRRAPHSPEAEQGVPLASGKVLPCDSQCEPC